MAADHCRFKNFHR